MGRGITRYMTLLCAIIMVLSVGGAWATWNYATNFPPKQYSGMPIRVGAFEYAPPPMPDGEVTLLERIYALLNNLYTNDLIEEINVENGYTSSRECLLTTLDKDWEDGQSTHSGTFVGSMDPTEVSKRRLFAMFGDIIDFDDPNSVSFILKSENLIGDWVNEVALYSTSDVIHYHSTWYNSVVGVYLSVFTPVYDEWGMIIGYELICDSVHGYCIETEYTQGSGLASFSTDHWRDELYYWDHRYPDAQPIRGEDRYKYECYHNDYGTYPYEGRPSVWDGYILVPSNQWEVGPNVGKRASAKLAEMLAKAE